MMDLIYYISPHTDKTLHNEKVLLLSPYKLIEPFIAEDPKTLLNKEYSGTIEVVMKRREKRSIKLDAKRVEVEKLGKIGSLIVLNIMKAVVENYSRFDDVEWFLILLQRKGYLPCICATVKDLIKSTLYFYNKYKVDRDIVIPASILVDYMLAFLGFLDLDQVKKIYDDMF